MNPEQILQDSYVRNLAETDWIKTLSLTAKDIKTLQSRIKNALLDSVYALIPPSQFDKSSWDCLYHKTKSGNVMTVFFPDDFAGEKFEAQEAEDFAKEVISDTIKTIQDGGATILRSSYHVCKIDMVDKIPALTVDQELAQYRYPFFVVLEFDMDFNRPKSDIIHASQIDDIEASLTNLRNTVIERLYETQEHVTPMSL